MSSIKKYLSLVKFSHTIFAMPFAIIGFFLGAYWLPVTQIKDEFDKNNVTSWSLYVEVPWIKLIFIIFCMIFARSAAMAFNRYLDRNFDAKNPRTAIREIPAGIISKESALRFVIINCLLFIIATFFINRICFFLSPVALFVILFYSYTKRFTPLCHLVLGIGLSLAPIGAYLAVTGAFPFMRRSFFFMPISNMASFAIFDV
jgi:4-hydroxybenzoate polyprenyltransferase